MPIFDYTHALSVGSICMPTHQLRRAAAASGRRFRCGGPFDWFAIGLAQCVHALETDFEDFYQPEGGRCLGAPTSRSWRVVDKRGVRSSHHLPKQSGDGAPTAQAWESFRAWLHHRRDQLRGTLHQPEARLLVVRLSEAGAQDSQQELVALQEAFVRRARGTVTLAAVSFGEEARVDESNALRHFSVARTWPKRMPPNEVDWGHDYGWGPAWRGSDASWDRVWRAV